MSRPGIHSNGHVRLSPVCRNRAHASRPPRPRQPVPAGDARARVRPRAPADGDRADRRRGRADRPLPRLGRPSGLRSRGGERFRPDLIGLGIRIIDDCIVVDRLDAPADEPIDVSFLLPEILELRRVLGEAAPEAVFVAGGAGFSACPSGVPRVPRRRVRRRRRGRGSHGHALFRHVLGTGPGTGPAGTGARDRRLPPRLRRADAPRAALRARELVPGANADRLRDAVRLLHGGEPRAAARERRAGGGAGRDRAHGAGARERGVGRVSIFFADDEFNLPDERHPIAVLQGILERGLAKHMTWRAYFNPTPFSAEFATSSARRTATCRSPSTAPPTRCSRPRRSRSGGAISTT